MSTAELGWDADGLAVAESRGWTEQAIVRWSLTWLPDQRRVGIPIRDGSGELFGALRYAPNGDGRTKMLAPAGVPRDLFPVPELVGDDEARRRGAVLLVEGEPDAIRAWSFGVPAVGVPGAQNWKDEWAGRLVGQGWRVVVVFDCDTPGRENAHRAAAAIVERGGTAYLVDLDPTRSDGYDLTEWARDREDPARDLLDAAAKAGLYDPEQQGPIFALEVADFRAELDEEHTPLLGSTGDVLIPDRGLVVVAGQPGVGKTTVVLDLVLHLASGREWLEIPVPRPLNVLLVENEGPEHMFRAKIDRKLSAWSHELVGRVWVQTWRWGLFSLADDDARKELIRFCLAHPVDVIVGDPLGTMGITGPGSPEETRRFVVQLLELGLPVTWLFVHHFRKDPSSSEVDQLSGAWAGHLDTLLLVKPTRRKDEVRLSFPKARWAESQRRPLMLGYVANTQGLERLGEEGDLELAVHQLIAAMAQDTWYTPTEAARAASLRRATVEEVLAGNGHLFESTVGKDVGRPKAKVVWHLVPEGGTSRKPHGEGDSAQAVLTLDDGTGNGDNLRDRVGQAESLEGVESGSTVPLPPDVPHLVPPPSLSERERDGDGERTPDKEGHVPREVIDPPDDEPWRDQF